MRSVLFITVGVTLTLLSLSPAHADVPVLDDAVESERADDETHSAHDTRTRSDLLEDQTVTNCNISNRERSRRLHRFPAQAVEEDRRNVELIRHYAEKHNVPVGLALSVAHAESGISTCSGSPTGVKGVMQLTRQTGLGMGFDRDINEENIEGGIQYLGTAVKACGRTNYACLAERYNGSNAREQADWAGKVGWNHAWFNAYAGADNINVIASPRFKSHVDYGSAATRQANGAAWSAIANAIDGMDEGTTKLQEEAHRISLLSGTAGASRIYQDSWDDNSRARAISAQSLNRLAAVNALFNELLQARLQIRLTKTSETTKALKTASQVNPFDCDIAGARDEDAQESDQHSCEPHGVIERDIPLAGENDIDLAIAASLLSFQNQADTAENGDLP